MMEAFDALNSVISKAQGSSGPSRGAGWKSRQQLRDRQKDRNRAETERLQAGAAEKRQKMNKYHFDPNNIINLGIYHPQFGNIPHGQTAENTRQRMRGMSELMDDIDPKRHAKALKKLKQILSGELVLSGDTETGERHHVHRDTMPYEWSEASGLADEEGEISEEDMDRIREHGIHGHVPASVGNEASDWLKKLGIPSHRIRDKLYCQIDGNNFVIPITKNGVSADFDRLGSGRAKEALHRSNPFNPDNRLTPAPDDDELWARKVQAWRDANTKDLSQAHRGVKFRDDAHPSDRGDLLSWWEPNLQREGDSNSLYEGDNITDSKLEAALEAGWKEPEHHSQPMISPQEQRLNAEVAAKTPVRGPSGIQSRALRATRSSAGGRPGVLTGMGERGVPVREEDEIAASSDTLPVTTPISTAFLFLKDGEMAPIQSPQDNMTTGGQQNSSTKSPGEASQELKDREMDHNATVNNPATQEWVDQILPSSQDFHQKMTDWYHSPGLAMHDPEYKKNAKPAEKAMMALSNMIAHFRARDDDTPGFGMKRDEDSSNSSTLDAQDKQFLGL